MTDSSTKKYCAFKAGFPCGEQCALFSQGCLLARLPTLLRNIEAELRETKLEAAGIRGGLTDIDGRLGDIVERLTPELE